MISKTRPILTLLAAAFVTAIAARHANAANNSVYIYLEGASGHPERNAPPGVDFIHFLYPEVGPFLATVTPPTVSSTNNLDVGGLYAAFGSHFKLASVSAPSGYGMLLTLKPGFGGFTAANNQVMLQGELEDPANTGPVAETGVEMDGLPDGAVFTKFVELDANGYNSFFFTADVKTGSSSGADPFGAFTFEPNNNEIVSKPLIAAHSSVLTDFPYTVEPLVLVGDTVVTTGDNYKTVKTVTTLTGSKGTLGDGRWRTSDSDSGDAELLVLLTFTDNTQEIDVIPQGLDYFAEYHNSYDWYIDLDTNSDVSGLGDYGITQFGLPSIDQNAFAVLAYLQQEDKSVAAIKSVAKPNAQVSTSSTSAAIITGGQTGSDPYVLLQVGDNIPVDANDNPWEGVNIAGISDPVVGYYGSVAAMVRLTGLPANANTGIYFYDSNNDYSEGVAPVTNNNLTPKIGTAIQELTGTDTGLIANVGAAAPDATGAGTVGHWASFISLVLPAVDYDNGYYDGFLLHANLASRPASKNLQISDAPNEAGPIFLATLKISAADGVNASNNLGLWALNGNGVLQLLLRSGEVINVEGLGTKKIRTFTALQTAPGANGAAIGYDDFGDVAVIATFTDGSSALLDVEMEEIGD